MKDGLYKDFPTYRLEKTSLLVAYARNARTHSQEQIKRLAASIHEFGFTNPVLTDGERGIIAGHGRVLAALMLGLDEVPTIELSHLSKAQRQAYVLADNRLALDAGWDTELLAAELGELKALDFDIGLTGFDAIELASIFADRSGGNTDPDDIPEPGEPITMPGDGWQMGGHRLACGDSTDPAIVARLLGSERPHLMVTDPPYGVEYDAAWRNEALRADGTSPNGRAIGAVKNDDRADWREAWDLFAGDVAYVWHAGRRAAEVQMSLEASGFEIRCQIIWAKQQFSISRGDYHWQHEPCWYAVRKGATGHWAGDRKQTTLWEIDKPHKSETGHSTQKPVECMRRPIENNSLPGDAIYEPFSGSGTTIIAAQMTGRRCFAIELNPLYVDIAVERWQNFTGQKAIRV